MKRDLLIGVRLLVLGAVFLPSFSDAEDLFDTLSDDVVTLDVITVVATKTPKSEDEVLPSVDTISGAELKMHQQYQIEDTRRHAAGTVAVQAGQAGGQTSIFIRGMESNHTVVLLNGRRLPPGLAGIYQVELLDTSYLESVQVTRGPASSLYGSDALAGAIDLRSADARHIDDDSFSVYSEAGSFSTFRGGGQIAVRDGQLGLIIDSSYFTTENDRPNSDFENSTFRINAAYELGKGVYFDILGYVQDATLTVPGSSLGFFFPENQLNRNQSSLFSPRLTIERDDWSASVFYSYTRNELEATRDVFLNDSLLNQMGHEAEAVFHYHPSDEATWTLGTGYYNYEFDRKPLIPGLFNQPAAHGFGYWSVFGQADFDLPCGFNILASGRYDGHDSFDSKATYSVQVSKEIESTETTIFGKVATGYKAPSGQDFIFLAPTVDPSSLLPEESQSWEVGVRQNLPNGLGNVSLTYFQADIENLIDVDPFTFVFPTQVDTETEGIEVETRLTPMDWLEIYANYTWLNATIVRGQYLAGFGGNPGDHLPRRPEHTLSGGFAMKGDKWSAGAEIQGAYERLDSPGVTIDDYTLLRIFGNYQLCKTVEFYGRVENFLDQKYEATRGFEGAGTGVFGGVRITF